MIHAFFSIADYLRLWMYDTLQILYAVVSPANCKSIYYLFSNNDKIWDKESSMPAVYPNANIISVHAFESYQCFFFTFF